jgi:hypothetical protein
MFAYPSRRSKYLTTAARLRRITAALAAAALGLVAWAAAVPAASARVIPENDFGDYEPARAATGTPVRVITTGGMPGWQIAVIALAAALVAAVTAVVLDRTRASRRSAASAG